LFSFVPFPLGPYHVHPELPSGPMLWILSRAPRPKCDDTIFSALILTNISHSVHTRFCVPGMPCAPRHTSFNFAGNTRLGFLHGAQCLASGCGGRQSD
jgi:hypothetical protein